MTELDRKLAERVAAGVKAESASREVIDGQLLVALDDKSKVAIVASEETLDFLIEGLSVLVPWSKERADKCRILVEDLKKLKREAFGGAG